ncbi:efflux transporter periplasmic adaptor subunit [Pseudoalteromonas phenolica]|uniref:Efflux transporter periplasmic adaptor subunit n=1 Tax=Pseudoalteromonas phenolica TaxID=161398 RepID=A0A4Q7IPZ8_9GAMM|nr:efflux RND transporter periplasmic adaptor subunit [Pseudoalteromonas phenolica]RZQ54060.1 efflux transporter periplasmic adaptor subunit [Pseudoalteromonas phenolica]
MYNKQSGKVLFPVLILILIAISGYFYLPVSHSKTGPSSRPATQVAAHIVSTDIKSINIDAVGTARANQAINVISAQSDYIESLAFADGEFVQVGQVLANLRDKQERLTVKELKINLKEQQRQLKRLQELARSQSAAQSQLEEQASEVDALQAKLANAESKLQEMVIKAPFSGVLGKRLVDIGSFVNSNTPFTTLDDISIIKVDFQVPEKYLAQLTQGMQVSAISDAYPNTPFTGEVTHIEPRINQATRSVSVTASFENETNLLRPGMLMQVALELGRIEALMVPEKSIIPRQENHFVYIIDDNDKAQQVKVELLKRFHGWVAIKSGLEAGQQVITEGTIKIRPGSSVTTQG